VADDSTKTFPVASGEIYAAAVGTTAPTSPNSALVSAYTNGMVGFLGPDGVTITPARQTQDNKAFQNGAVVSTQQTEFKATVDFAMLEYNEETALLYYGNVTHVDTTSFYSDMTAAAMPHYSWVIEFVDGGLKKTRFWFPDAKITDQSAEVFKNGDQALLPVTLTAYPDSSGRYYRKFVDHDITVSS
jgi:hypothetical protein